MQEETTNRTVSLVITGGRITANVLKAAMRKYLNHVDKQVQKRDAVKQAARNEEAKVKAKAKAEKKIEASKPHGKQSMKSLMSYGTQLTNIKITDNNIKSFDKVARKYDIDYSLKRDDSTKPPKYLVFFKAKDVDVMTAAFKEYAGISLKKTKKPSIKQKLFKAKERAAKHRQRERVKQKDRGQSL